MDIVNREYKILETENGIIDLEIYCGRDNTRLNMNWCEENCHRYYSCQYVADANDYLVKLEELQ